MSRTTRVRLEDGTDLIAPERLLSRLRYYQNVCHEVAFGPLPKRSDESRIEYEKRIDRYVLAVAPEPQAAGAVLIDATEPPIVVRARDVADGHAAWVRDMCRGTVCGALAHLDKQGSKP